jgi:hypothetical protein
MARKDSQYILFTLPEVENTKRMDSLQLFKS